MMQLQKGLRQFTDGAAAFMLAALFAVFLVQIAARYLFDGRGMPDALAVAGVLGWCILPSPI